MAKKRWQKGATKKTQKVDKKMINEMDDKKGEESRQKEVRNKSIYKEDKKIRSKKIHKKGDKKATKRR